MRRLTVLLFASVLLATGCSLPLSRDVREVGEIAGESRPGAQLQVIPPGPKAGASPEEAVLGFLGAQASSDREHAIARAFLTAQAHSRWHDASEVQVYDPDRLVVTELPGSTAEQAVVRVVSVVTGRVAADGSYVGVAAVTATDDYTLQRVQRQWRLAQVPDGLRLTAADRQRAFLARPVYYLAPRLGDSSAHLVPDQVFLPADGDQATALVTRLLRSPSAALAGSVVSAVPEAVTLHGPVDLDGAGVATVDLRGFPQRPTGDAAQDLSAQVVWTLRSLGASFRGLRLLVDGSALVVPGESGVQDAGAWDAYDPEGLGPQPPYYFSFGRRLRASLELPTGPATAGDVGDGQAVAVDAVAVTPDRTEVALLEGRTPGQVTVRVGPLRGTVYPVVARAAGLSSPTWGSGDQGLWLLRGGREIVRVDNGLHPVTVLGQPPGSLQALALSRDGVRVALVVAGRLHIGRIEQINGQPRVVALTQVSPTLQRVTDVAWASSTELVALGGLTRAVQLVRLAVDGSSVRALNTAGLVPTEVAASPKGVVVVSQGRLFLSDGGAFRQVQSATASAPTFPG